MKLLHLITGVEIVGQTEDNGDYYTVKHPVEIRLVTNGSDQKPTNWVGPFATFVRGNVIHINKSKILFVGDPIPSLIDYYDETVLGKASPGIEEARKAATFELTEEEVAKLEEPTS